MHRAKNTKRRPRRRRCHLPLLAILAACPVSRAAGSFRRRGPSLIAADGDACHSATRADGDTIARRRRRDPAGGSVAASSEGRTRPLAAGTGGSLSRRGGGAAGRTPDARSLASSAAAAAQHSASAAGTAIVLSGCFGAVVASRLIAWLAGRAAAAESDPGLRPLVILRRAIPSGELPILASSVGIAVMSGLGIGGGDAHARFADMSFIGSMWAYAKLVDPFFAGAVGCAYAAITAVTSVMSSRRLIDLVSGIVAFRLKGLGDDFPYESEWDARVSRTPVETNKRTGDAALASVANRLASGSLLLTFPQQCLGLYLLTGAVVSWLSDRSVGVRAGKVLVWFGDGIGRRAGEASPSIDPRKLSSRLLVTHWAIFLAKMAFQLSFGIGVAEILGALTPRHVTEEP